VKMSYGSFNNPFDTPDSNPRASSSNPFGETPPPKSSEIAFKAEDIFGKASPAPPTQQVVSNTQSQSFENVPISEERPSDRKSTPLNSAYERIDPEPSESPTPEREQLLTENEATSEPTSEQQGKPVYHIWNVQYYSGAFNVTTLDVFYRIMLTLMPWRRKFFLEVEDNPDFYGPFWISATLIFAVTAASNMNSFYKSFNTAWDYNMSKVIAATSTIVGYTVALPIILWFVLHYLGSPKKLLILLCLYGYAVFVFIPAAFISIIPTDIAKWTVMLFGSGLSGIFLINNIYGSMESLSIVRTVIVIAVMLACHVVLTLMLILYFF